MAENKAPGLILYQDDATGKVYAYDIQNKKLVEVWKNGKPNIGDKGDQSIQDQEEEERRKQIEKEREEAQAAKDDGEEYDEEALKDWESEEERAQRLQDIQDMLNDESTSSKAQGESKTKIDRELAKKKAATLRNSKNSKLQRFKNSLDQFINKETRAQRRKTWQKPHASYEGTGIIRQGRRRETNPEIPLINVYFDQSGSWNSDDIAVGMEAIGVLKNYEDRHEIKVNLYYFANHIHDNPEEAKQEGGTRAGAELLEHVRSTHPDNVIVMTDGDFDHYGFDDSRVIIPGAVWFLFREEVSEWLKKNLAGRKQTLAFII